MRQVETDKQERASSATTPEAVARRWLQVQAMIEAVPEDDREAQWQVICVCIGPTGDDGCGGPCKVAEYDKVRGIAVGWPCCSYCKVTEWRG